MTVLMLRGFAIHKDYLGRDRQERLVEAVREIVRAAPLFSPQTPYGKPMSVRMTSAGDYGWYADRSGYRYTPTHPNGAPWPNIPEEVLSIWRDLVGEEKLPECCLVNFYGETARMGLHQDRDEADFDWPVVSVSLGDSARFRIGNTERGGSTESVWLESGDVVVMGGAARLTYHGVDAIRYGSSNLLDNGGRLNLTLRVVT
ncbi:alpha-ketoglutarate-dependent dioxygenase AlkB [Aliishimia ponticola]|uniref:Alpha-ketoglutarate-dependent dioxygenase AlkB n=1 Tax=Aliishimia ponticola TaxID=2499833 RepID=A0A4S4N6D3_9RHOB|nr:alpha-ketoglutarate-dependent dioxygenase AlkB [Aliishimia ponticola]THH34694.1 alpha-ketoglutarate-dependent dioxygenase AlkB [Aliishimia ponticola]